MSLHCKEGNLFSPSFTEEVGLEVKQDASVTETRFDSPVSRRKFGMHKKKGSQLQPVVIITIVLY